MVEEPKKLKSWSASKFECYKQCPWKFWCLYIKGETPDLVSKYINFGNTTHGVLDWAGKEKECPAREVIIEETKQLWIPSEDDEARFEEYKEKGYERWKYLGYKDRNEEISFQKMALQMLFDYLLNKPFIRPFKTEQFLVYDWIDDYRLVAKVDRIEVFDENGEHVEVDFNTNVETLKSMPGFDNFTFKVLDFKTGQNKNRQSIYQLRGDLANNIYAWATLKFFGFGYEQLPKFQFGHYYLRNDDVAEPGEVVTALTEDHIKKAFHKMESLAYNVSRGIFPKKESYLCNYCEFEKPCKG